MRFNNNEIAPNYENSPGEACCGAELEAEPRQKTSGANAPPYSLETGNVLPVSRDRVSLEVLTVNLPIEPAGQPKAGGKEDTQKNSTGGTTLKKIYRINLA